MAGSPIIQKRIAEWREQLLDLSKRNRLINCRIGRSGALELEHPGAAPIWREIVSGGRTMRFPRKRDLVDLPDEDGLLDVNSPVDAGKAVGQKAPADPSGTAACFEQSRVSPRLRGEHLLTRLGDKAMDGKLTRLALAAKTSSSEQGVNSLYLGFGVLRWYESKDSEVPLLAPLLLAPARLKRDSADTEWQLSLLEDELVPNHCLNELLRTNFGLQLPVLSEEADLADDPDGYGRYQELYRVLIRGHRRWEVQDRCVLGAFGFQKVAMWQDLGQNVERIAGHAVCRAVGGDSGGLGTDGAFITGSGSLDESTPPAQTHHILDCDSTQWAAIEAVKRGSHLVLDGPPGTGKSQTIANLIAEFLAGGRTVLFVSEKAAALDVVKRRLDQAGLGDFCLELHSHKSNKKEVIGELGQALKLQPEHYPPQDDTLRELEQVRATLNEYVGALHVKRFALGRSAYQVHGRLAAVADAPATRCPIERVQLTTPAQLAHLCRTIRALAQQQDALRTANTHPWRACRARGWTLTLEDDVRHHFPRLSTLLSELLAKLGALHRLGFCNPDPGLGDIRGILAEAEAALQLPQVPAAWFNGDARAVAESYIRLNELANRFATVRQLVPQYNAAAIDATASPHLLRQLETTDEWLSRVMPHPATGVRGTAQHLSSIADELRAVADLAHRMHGSAEHVLRLLHRTPDAAFPLSEVPRTVVVANMVASMGRVRRSWFDRDERSRLHLRLDGWAAKATAIADERTKLERLFREAAFERGADDLLAKVGRYRSRVKRLAPRWQELYKEWKSLHRTATPRSVYSCFNEAATILEYRRRASSLLAEVRATASRAGSALEPLSTDWRTLQARLEGWAEEAAAIATERAELAKMFAESAFGSEGSDVFTEVSRHSFFALRLLPSWFRTRRQFCALRHDVTPGAAKQCLRDAAAMLRHRGRVNALIADMGLADERGQLQSAPRGAAWKTLQAKLLVWAQTAESLADEHEALEAVLSPAAFEAGGEAVFRKINRYRTFLRRRLRRWRSVRRGFLSLCRPSDPRPAKARVRDAAALQQHRHDVAELVAEIGSDAGRIGWDAARRDFDWGQLREELDRIDQVEAIQPLAQELVVSLELTGVDRPALTGAAQQLKSLYELLTAAMRRADEVFTVDADHALERSAPAIHQDLATALEALAKRINLLASLSCLLEQDADTELAACGQDFASLAELREVRAAARKVAAGIGPNVQIPPELHGTLWAAEAATAQALLSAVSSDHWPPKPHQIAVMSDATVRADLGTHFQMVGAAWAAPRLAESLHFVEQLFDLAEPVAEGFALATAPISAVTEWLADRAADVASLQQWLHLRDTLDAMRDAKLMVLAEEMQVGTVPPLEAERAFLKRFYRRWLDEAYAETFALSRFRVEDHESAISRFQELDRELVSRAFERVRAGQLSVNASWRGGGYDAPARSERGLLVAEVSKKRRHLPVRQLFRRMPTLLLKLKPCLMMSPLAVSTYLDSDRIGFDLVIFDEASQVRPHDAIGAIYRGKQLVVAGDEKQLPPTTFFERTGGEADTADNDEAEGVDDEDADVGSTADIESILQACKRAGLSNQQLRWHYRSRRESLIAFSNVSFYDGNLVTFPSALDVDGSSGVRLEYVADGRWQGGATGKGINAAEARRTAELVMRHVKQTPGLSLGVVTMNQAQQLQVMEEIERRRKSGPAYAEFFDEENDEPFFVKNLENVQGDERDVIFLCVTYARNATGTLSHNFGPLNSNGGERRLNVAATRSRQNVVVISSIKSGDIDLARTSARGVHLLRTYLDFADRGPIALAAAVTDAGQADFDSDFEAAVAEALAAENLIVRRQVGCGGFRIDLALVDPERPGRYVLGVECDGATYHSSATARDRDRLRQEVLEGLGWTICRIWSTDWVRDPRRQIGRVLDAYKRARDAMAEPVQHVPPARPPAKAPRVTTREAGEPAKTVDAPPPTEGASGNGKASAARAGDPDLIGMQLFATPQLGYTSIDDVPGKVIDGLIIQLLAENGITPQEDLTRTVARRLGFNRTGTRITNKVRQRIYQLTRAGALERDDEGNVYAT